MEDNLEPDEFRCLKCKNVFVKTQTDEQAVEGMKEDFGTESLEGMALVCEKCYDSIMIPFKN